MHSWSGPHGVPGGMERWEHGSYRWRRAVEAVALAALAVILAPRMLAIAEVAVGAVLALVEARRTDARTRRDGW